MTDQTEKTFDVDDMTTAMCLWSAMLGLAAGTASDEDDSDGDDDDLDGDGDPDGDDDADDDATDEGDEDDADRDADEEERAQEMLDEHGSFTVRAALVDLVRPCRDKWKEHVGDDDTDEQFDFDWCPAFLREAIGDGTLDAAIERQYQP